MWPWRGVGRGLRQWRQPAQREGSFSSWSTHIVSPTVTWKHREQKDPPGRLTLRMSTGAADGAFEGSLQAISNMYLSL